MEELLELQYQKLSEEYEELTNDYDKAKRTTLVIIENLKDEVKVNGRKQHIEIIPRTKTFDSVIEKCKRKGIDYNIEDIKKNIHDIVGIRIITTYIDAIIPIKETILKQPSIAVIEERDYITKPKDNGYRGYHLIVTVNEYIGGRTVSIPVEIQIRTKGMDLWASVEHDCCYKRIDPDEEATVEFSKLAKFLFEFEETAVYLRNNILNSEED